MLSAGQILNGNRAWVRILWLWLCQKKGKASTWNSEGKLASAITMSLDISPNTCFISTAFLYTKRYCQALEAASGMSKSILVGRVIRQRAPQGNVLFTYSQQASPMKGDISWLCFLSFITGHLSSSRKGIVLPSTPSFYHCISIKFHYSSEVRLITYFYSYFSKVPYFSKRLKYSVSHSNICAQYFIWDQFALFL